MSWRVSAGFGREGSAAKEDYWSYVSALQPSSIFLSCNKNSAELRSLKYDDGANYYIWILQCKNLTFVHASEIGLESCARAGATARVAELGYRIEHGGKEPPPPKAHNQAPIPAQVTASSPHHAPYKEVTNGYPGSTPESLPMRSRQSMYSSEYRLGRCFIWNGAKLKLVQARLLFKESPFYEILGPLTQTAGLAGKSIHPC